MRDSTRASDLGFLQLTFERADDASEEGFALAAQRVDFLRELRVLKRVGVAEGKVFELAAQFAHAEAVRERSVTCRAFRGRCADLLFGLQVLERAHVVQAVGELDDDDANVSDHREQHLADVFGLVVFAVGELDFVELGDAFDDVRDLLAEALGDVGGCDVGVFDGVVQQAGGDGGGVHFELGKNLRDFQWMDDVGFAGRALLVGVMLHGEDPRPADEVQVVGGAVGAYGFEHVLETGFNGSIAGDGVSGVFGERWWGLFEGTGGLIERHRMGWHHGCARSRGQRSFQLQSRLACCCSKKASRAEITARFGRSRRGDDHGPLYGGRLFG